MLCFGTLGHLISFCLHHPPTSILDDLKISSQFKKIIEQKKNMPSVINAINGLSHSMPFKGIA